MKLIKEILHLAIPSIATFSSMTVTGLLILMIVGKLGGLGQKAKECLSPNPLILHKFR